MFAFSVLLLLIAAGTVTLGAIVDTYLQALRVRSLARYIPLCFCIAGLFVAVLALFLMFLSFSYPPDLREPSAAARLLT